MFAQMARAGGVGDVARFIVDIVVGPLEGDMETSVDRILDQKGWVVHTINPDATVYEAIEAMVDRQIGALVVTDGDGEMVGIMTERDYMTKIALLGRQSPRTFVQEIMTDDVVVVESNYTVRQCLFVMTQKRCRHLPVVADGSVAGLVSIGDCAREIAHDRDVTIQYFIDYIQGRYPA